MSEPRVSIVIVTWNKKEFVLDLLDSIQTLNYSNYDVIVVDNCSTDNTAEAIADKHPQVFIIKNPENSGGAGGFNIGLQYAEDKKYQYCWLLDNDVIVDKDALSCLVDTLKSIPQASICGSQILIFDSETVQECGGIIDWHRGSISLNEHGKKRLSNESNHVILEVDYCAACSMLVRMKDVVVCGKIDPEMFIFWDDIEWSTRIKSFGKKILCNTDSVVWHHFNGYKPSTSWRVYYRIRNKLFFFQKYSSNCKNIHYLSLLYKELAAAYHYIGIKDFAFAVDSAILDFEHNIRGKWLKQSLSTASFSLGNRLTSVPPDNYLIHYDHNYEKLDSIIVGKTSHHIVIDHKLSFIALLSLILTLLLKPSITVANQLNVLMLFSSFSVLLTEEGKIILKNSKIKNCFFLLYRFVIFSTKLSVSRMTSFMRS